MRTPAALCLAILAASASVRGQTAGGVHPAATIRPAPYYRVIFTSGEVQIVEGYEVGTPFVVLTGLHRGKTTYSLSSVAKVEPLSQMEASQSIHAQGEPVPATAATATPKARSAAKGLVPKEAPPKPRAARNLASSTPPPRPAVPPPPQATVSPPAPGYVAPSAGYTATGLELHVGPRGGVYHYSASGKKVYQKHK